MPHCVIQLLAYYTANLLIDNENAYEEIEQ